MKHAKMSGKFHR